LIETDLGIAGNALQEGSEAEKSELDDDSRSLREVKSDGVPLGAALNCEADSEWKVCGGERLEESQYDQDPSVAIASNECNIDDHKHPLEGTPN
jgi:hypothetical protein